jgi:toxin HigB-1
MYRDARKRYVSQHKLKAPPGNRLEALKKDRQGQHSVRVNEKWRVCSVWDAKTGNASEVEVVDYH